MEQVKAEPVAWECFCDHSYYDMWCVRQVGQRTFGEGFHLMRGVEAQALCDMLNATPQPAAVEGLVELVSDMMREVFISGADWGRTRPGHFSDYLADAIKPHLEALTKIKQP